MEGKRDFHAWLTEASGYKHAMRVIPQIVEILQCSPHKGEAQHGLSVAEICLDACDRPQDGLLVEPLIIAAYAHDIERGYDPEHGLTKEVFLGDYEAYKHAHAWRSAAVITKLLRDNEAPDWLIKSVRETVVLHEDGGTIAADLVCDADSVSFLKDVIMEFASKNTREQTMKKLEWMYKRIRYDTVREKYHPLYLERLHWVENYFNNPTAE